MLFDCFDSKRKLLGPLKLRGKCSPFSFSVRLSLNWCIHLCLLHSLPCFRVFGSRPSNRTNFRRNDLCWPFGKKVVYLQAELLLLLQPQRNTKIDWFRTIVDWEMDCSSIAAVFPCEMRRDRASGGLVKKNRLTTPLKTIKRMSKYGTLHNSASATTTTTLKKTPWRGWDAVTGERGNGDAVAR